MRLLQSVRSMTTRPDLAEAYDFVLADKKDVPAIVEMCCTGFTSNEPHSKALKITPEQSRPVYDYLVRKCLHYPYSRRVIEKATNEMIGFSLISVGYRDKSKEYSPYAIEGVPLPDNVMEFENSLEKSKARFWEAVDENVQKVLRGEVFFLVPEHQRKGIASNLLYFGFDFEKLKKSGFDGVVSEASSKANQILLSANGYKCLVEPDNKLQMHDGTEGIRVFFKDLRN